MKKANGYLILIFLFFTAAIVPASDLLITPEDLYIEQDLSGGYQLWIRKKPGLGSVLITDSSQDPAKEIHSYALRNPRYHPINGDEKRILDGKYLDNKAGIYSLIDSTPEANSRLGEAFHIFIPYIVIYGYAWTRNGKIQVMDGTYLNLRTFSKPYADYSGGFLDNPFLLQVTQKPLSGPPEQNFMPEAVESFKDIADKGEGKFIATSGKEDIGRKIDDVLTEEVGNSLDLVLVLDTTKSMADDLPYLKQALIPLLEKHTKRFEKFRIGIVLYKDYGELYLTKNFPFESDLDAIQRMINSIDVYGGRDIPEAIYEALYESIRVYHWEAESRLIILIGDAPPHPEPRGEITEEMVYIKARESEIKITTIILPQ